MKRLSILAGITSLIIASPAPANHLVGNHDPFPSRGACESYTAEGMAEDRGPLLDNFPQFFNNEGDVASFLTRAWTCELNESDGQWYIGDHRFDVLNSDWYQHRH
jgi:hypothetical protein